MSSATLDSASPFPNLWVVFTCLFAAKPISLVERCWCRSTLNTVPQRSIKELKFLHTPNCPFQVM